MFARYQARKTAYTIVTTGKLNQPPARWAWLFAALVTAGLSLPRAFWLLDGTPMEVFTRPLTPEQEAAIERMEARRVARRAVAR